MSDHIFVRGGVYVVRYWGGEGMAAPSDDDRTCYQFSNGAAFVTLCRRDAIDAALAVLADNPLSVSFTIARAVAGQR